MPCSETSPANDVNMLSDGNTSQNIRNCRMGELPFVPGVTPKASGYGRMRPDLAQLHAVLIMCLLIHVPINQTKNV